MHVFNGIKLAIEKESLLRDKITRNFPHKKLKIAAILFREDSGSRLYTNLKKEAAKRIGIDYEVYEFSLSKKNTDHDVTLKISELNNDSSVTGIIIQKPWRRTWISARRQTLFKDIVVQEDLKQYQRKQYQLWWRKLTSQIVKQKDVDGLSVDTIEDIKQGTWKENNRVLPATCRAVLTIIDRVGELSNKKCIIIGKSDLLGKPLYYELLRRNNLELELIASKELSERMESQQKLLDADMIVSATGKKNLLTGDMVANGVIIIDVGEPSGDVEFNSVSKKASFITPVPGGVGPMTVVSLLQNCVDLATYFDTTS